MIKNSIYLKLGYIPTEKTTIYCDNCNHVLNAGPKYKPRFCDMCGSPIKENLDKIEWKTDEVSWLDYVKYILDNHPEYIIMKVKYECTDHGLIGLPKTIESCPVLIGKDIDEIINFANEYGSMEYTEEELEPATKKELYEYAKICGKFWKD